MASEADSPRQRRQARVFNLVNAAQWILIFVVANILTNTGHAAWIMPSVIFIIGLHFLPLAWLFANRAHYITGAVLTLFSALYPALAPGDPADPPGCPGAGLILWMSSAWALRTVASDNDPGARAAI